MDERTVHTTLLVVVFFVFWLLWFLMKNFGRLLSSSPGGKDNLAPLVLFFKATDPIPEGSAA